MDAEGVHYQEMAGKKVWQQSSTGSIMFDVGHEGWVVAEDGKVHAEKTGKGTQSSILGWITSGDSSIEASRNQGEITHISHMDYHASHILGIIGDCTLIVYGK